jgi:succinate dehydrogenase / fumarate reductase iron-sulfur subunit
MDQACLLVGSNVQPAKLFLFDRQLLEPNLWQYADCAVPCTEDLSEYKLDGSLSFRRSCAHGICGSDAMRINGSNMLVCKTLVRDAGAKITVEPMLGLKVVKDLIVDMDPFFNNYKKMLLYLINQSPLPADGKERLQSPEQRARFDETTKCILCAACTTSCPSFWASEEYYGPAALMTAHRFVFDSRDEGASQRLQILSETNGTARCHTAYNCTNAYPRGIHITKAIGELKLALVTGKID